MLKIDDWREVRGMSQFFEAWDDYINDAQDMFTYHRNVTGVAWFTEPYISLIRKLC